MPPLEIGQLVEQVVALERVLLQSRGIRLDLDVDSALVWHFDEDLIVGVVSHAVNNAVHYTRDRILLGAREREGWLEIRVEDNGAGYPDALRQAGSAAMSGTAIGVNFLTNSAGLGLHFSREVTRMYRHRERPDVPTCLEMATLLQPGQQRFAQLMEQLLGLVPKVEDTVGEAA